MNAIQHCTSPRAERPGGVCGNPLWSWDEQQLRTCNRCADRMAEREQYRREWAYYHPSGDAEPQS